MDWAMEMYLNMNYCLIKYLTQYIMALPELIYAPIDGGTIHRYEISGGKRKFSIICSNNYVVLEKYWVPSVFVYLYFMVFVSFVILSNFLCNQ